MVFIRNFQIFRSDSFRSPWRSHSPYSFRTLVGGRCDSRVGRGMFTAPAAACRSGGSAPRLVGAYLQCVKRENLVLSRFGRRGRSAPLRTASPTGERRATLLPHTAREHPQRVCDSRAHRPHPQRANKSYNSSKIAQCVRPAHIDP